MQKITIAALVAVFFVIGQNLPALSNEFREREATIAQYKSWLDSLGPRGSRFWVRLEERRRPHRLYLAEGFYRADAQSQEQFVNIFSHYLAGHPEKSMLIDLFDSRTNVAVGEFGFGGFKLYPEPARTAASLHR
jgi:hypothetical protein